MDKASTYNELTFQLIVESAPSAMILVNKEAKIAYTNTQIEKLFGYSKTELMGQPIEILIPPRFAAAHPQLRNMFMASPHARAMGAGRELFAIRKDGTEFPVEIGLNPLVTVDGTWVVAAIIDITERKKFEEQKTLFASIIDSSEDAILSKTLDGIITSWNRGAVNIFGYQLNEVLGKDISILIPQHLKNAEKEIIEKVEKGESVQHYETERIRKDGKIINVALTISPIKDSRGKIIGASKICRDITKDKEAEKKLLKVNRLYSFISHINQSIVHFKDRQSLFDKVCEIATKLGEFKYAWVGILDENTGKVNLVAHSGIATEDLPIYYNLDYKSPTLISTPLGKAITTGECAYSNDIQNDTNVKGFEELSVKRGYRSTMILPIKQSGKIVGVFCCNSLYIDFFDKEEINLLVEAAGDISFALDNFEKEDNRLLYEKRLEESELSLNEAQEVANIGSWEHNYVTDIVIWSEEQCKIYGVPPDQTIQSRESFLSFIHPDDAAFVREEVERAQFTMEDHSFYCKVIRKDGVIRHVNIRSKFKLDESGKPIAIYGITHDVTDRRNAEERLEVIDVAFKYADTSIFIIKKDASFYDFNDAAHTRLGYTKDELMYITIPDIDPDYDAEVWPKHWQELRNHGATSFFSKHRKKDGTLMDVQINLRMINYKGLELNCALVTDVTEKKRTEEELLLNNAVLKKTNAELDRFVYSISHELRMPLTSIMGLQTLIKKEQLDNKNKGILEMIKRSTFGMDEVLREILDYSKNSRIETKITKIEFATLIENAFESWALQQEYISIDKRITINEIAPFYSDKVRMKIIINNLISNALKYQNKDILDAFIAINIVVDEIKLTLEVSDNGIGIKANHLPNIFKMFFRSTANVSGSGLGLYIVKESIEKLGGTIMVESESGKGTRFSVEIPNNNLTYDI